MFEGQPPLCSFLRLRTYPCPRRTSISVTRVITINGQPLQGRSFDICVFSQVVYTAGRGEMKLAQVWPMVVPQRLLIASPKQGVKDVECLESSYHALFHEVVRSISFIFSLDTQRLDIDRVEHGALQFVEFVELLGSETRRVEGDMVQLRALLLVAQEVEQLHKLQSQPRGAETGVLELVGESPVHLPAGHLSGRLRRYNDGDSPGACMSAVADGEEENKKRHT